jgi:hypothetical protein
VKDKETEDQRAQRIDRLRDFWHAKFAPFNPGREFVVLFGDNAGKPSMALMQLDNGGAISTGDIQPVNPDGTCIAVFVQERG